MTTIINGAFVSTVGSVVANEPAEYEAMDFVGKSSPEAEDPSVYLTIPDSLLSTQHKSRKETADSTIGPETVAQKLATTTDDDAIQNYQVTCVFLIERMIWECVRFFCGQ